MRLQTIVLLLRREGLEPNIIREALKCLRTEEGDIFNSPLFQDGWEQYIRRPYDRIYKGSSLEDAMRQAFPRSGPLIIISPERMIRFSVVEWRGEDGIMDFCAAVCDYTRHHFIEDVDFTVKEDSIYSSENRKRPIHPEWTFTEVEMYTSRL